jgi:hypothetical protein
MRSTVVFCRPGNIGAAKVVQEKRFHKDDSEFEVEYVGPNGHGVMRKAVGCKPFFDKLKLSKEELSQLAAYSSAMESHINGSDPDTERVQPDGSHAGEQGSNAVFELLNGLISKFSLAVNSPEHFYISCVIQANGNLDFAAGVEEENGRGRRFKKKPRTMPYIFPRKPDNPGAVLPVCCHKSCATKDLNSIGYGTGVRHGEWCDASLTPKWEAHLVLHLLWPGLLMKDLASECRSVVLASGSLAPLQSLCAELDLQDEETSKTGRLQTKPRPLEANHVVSLPKQLLALSVGHFPDGSPLTVTYNNYKQSEFFPRLGNAIASVVEAIPRGGVLVFFPSYTFMKKCINCWNPFENRNRGWNNFDYGNDNSCPQIWDRFVRSKGKVIVEPTGSQEKFEKARDEYTETIQREGRCILLAVFRGKMSEGISFNDDNARGVICVGIPFPGARDRAIVAKKSYNDEQRRLAEKKSLLPGQDWYAQEAFRAIAQALGRCIRHAADYGTIVLLDSRHCHDGSPGFSHSKLPKWMRDHVRTLSMGHRGLGNNPVVGGYPGLVREMKAFFQQAPVYANSVLEKNQQLFAAAQERDKNSSGHQFNSKTGSWTPNAVTGIKKDSAMSATSVNSANVTQDSPMPPAGSSTPLVQPQLRFAGGKQGANKDENSHVKTVQDENRPRN